MKKTILLCGASLWALTLTSAFAESEFDEKNWDGDEIIVSASRYEQPISNIGTSLTVISEQEIEKFQTVFVQDILQSVPGVSLNQNGPFGGSSSIRIRGNSSDQTVILIDGVQVNDVSSPGGSFNFANLEPSAIERVEVLRGPQSILYGSDAIGGVINVLTKSGEEGLGGGLFIEAGSYATVRGGGNVYGGNDKISGNLIISGITTNGISKADENNGNTEDDGYENITAHGKVTAKIADFLTTEIIARYSDSENEFDSFGPADGDEVGHSKEYLIAGKWHFDLLDGDFLSTLSVDYAKTDRQNLTNGAESFAAEGERFNIDYFGNYKINESIRISFGAQHEELDILSDTNRDFNIDSLLTELGYTGQDGLDGLTLTAGIRYDDHSTFGGVTTGRITAAYFVEETGTKVFANWGEGFKAPTVFQLTFVCCGLLPATDLNPEESDAWEIGLEQRLWDDRIMLGITYFDQDTDNLIIFSPTFEAGTPAYLNVDQASSKGLELSAFVQVLDNLSIQANYTYTDAKNRITDAQLIRVPENAAFGRIDWQVTEKASLTLDITYNGEEAERFGQTVDGWVRFDIKGTYQITEHFEIYGRIDNLFDEDYQQILGYGTPGTSGFVGVRGQF